MSKQQDPRPTAVLPPQIYVRTTSFRNSTATLPTHTTMESTSHPNYQYTSLLPSHHNPNAQSIFHNHYQPSLALSVNSNTYQSSIPSQNPLPYQNPDGHGTYQYPGCSVMSPPSHLYPTAQSYYNQQYPPQPQQQNQQMHKPLENQSLMFFNTTQMFKSLLHPSQQAYNPAITTQLYHFAAKTSCTDAAANTNSNDDETTKATFSKLLTVSDMLTTHNILSINHYTTHFKSLTPNPISTSIIKPKAILNVLFQSFAQWIPYIPDWSQYKKLIKKCQFTDNTLVKDDGWKKGVNLQAGNAQKLAFSHITPSNSFATQTGSFYQYKPIMNKLLQCSTAEETHINNLLNVININLNFSFDNFIFFEVYGIINSYTAIVSSLSTYTQQPDHELHLLGTTLLSPAFVGNVLSQIRKTEMGTTTQSNSIALQTRPKLHTGLSKYSTSSSNLAALANPPSRAQNQDQILSSDDGNDDEDIEVYISPISLQSSTQLPSTQYESTVYSKPTATRNILANHNEPDNNGNITSINNYNAYTASFKPSYISTASPTVIPGPNSLENGPNTSNSPTNTGLSDIVDDQVSTIHTTGFPRLLQEAALSKQHSHMDYQKKTNSGALLTRSSSMTSSHGVDSPSITAKVEINPINSQPGVNNVHFQTIFAILGYSAQPDGLKLPLDHLFVTTPTTAPAKQGINSNAPQSSSGTQGTVTFLLQNVESSLLFNHIIKPLYTLYLKALKFQLFVQLLARFWLLLLYKSNISSLTSSTYHNMEDITDSTQYVALKCLDLTNNGDKSTPKSEQTLSSFFTQNPVVLPSNLQKLASTEDTTTTTTQKTSSGNITITNNSSSNNQSESIGPNSNNVTVSMSINNLSTLSNRHHNTNNPSNDTSSHFFNFTYRGMMDNIVNAPSDPTSTKLTKQFTTIYQQLSFLLMVFSIHIQEMHTLLILCQNELTLRTNTRFEPNSVPTSNIPSHNSAANQNGGNLTPTTILPQRHLITSLSTSSPNTPTPNTPTISAAGGPTLFSLLQTKQTNSTLLLTYKFNVINIVSNYINMMYYFLQHSPFHNINDVTMNSSLSSNLSREERIKAQFYSIPIPLLQKLCPLSQEQRYRRDFRDDALQSAEPTQQSVNFFDEKCDDALIIPLTDVSKSPQLISSGSQIDMVDDDLYIFKIGGSNSASPNGNIDISSLLTPAYGEYDSDNEYIHQKNNTNTKDKKVDQPIFSNPETTLGINPSDHDNEVEELLFEQPTIDDGNDEILPQEPTSNIEKKKKDKGKKKKDKKNKKLNECDDADSSDGVDATAQLTDQSVDEPKIVDTLETTTNHVDPEEHNAASSLNLPENLPNDPECDTVPGDGGKKKKEKGKKKKDKEKKKNEKKKSDIHKDDGDDHGDNTRNYDGYDNNIMKSDLNPQDDSLPDNLHHTITSQSTQVSPAFVPTYNSLSISSDKAKSQLIPSSASPQPIFSTSSLLRPVKSSYSSITHDDYNPADYFDIVTYIQTIIQQHYTALFFIFMTIPMTNTSGTTSTSTNSTQAISTSTNLPPKQQAHGDASTTNSPALFINIDPSRQLTQQSSSDSTEMIPHPNSLLYFLNYIDEINSYLNGVSYCDVLGREDDFIHTIPIEDVNEQIINNNTSAKGKKNKKNKNKSNDEENGQSELTNNLPQPSPTTQTQIQPVEPPNAIYRELFLSSKQMYLLLFQKTLLNFNIYCFLPILVYFAVYYHLEIFTVSALLLSLVLGLFGGALLLPILTFLVNFFLFRVCWKIKVVFLETIRNIHYSRTRGLYFVDERSSTNQIDETTNLLSHVPQDPMSRYGSVNSPSLSYSDQNYDNGDIEDNHDSSSDDETAYYGEKKYKHYVYPYKQPQLDIYYDKIYLMLINTMSICSNFTLFLVTFILHSTNPHTFFTSLVTQETIVYWLYLVAFGYGMTLNINNFVKNSIVYDVSITYRHFWIQKHNLLKTCTFIFLSIIVIMILITNVHVVDTDFSSGRSTNTAKHINFLNTFISFDDFFPQHFEDSFNTKLPFSNTSDVAITPNINDHPSQSDDRIPYDEVLEILPKKAIPESVSKTSSRNVTKTNISSITNSFFESLLYDYPLNDDLLSNGTTSIFEDIDHDLDYGDEINYDTHHQSTVIIDLSIPYIALFFSGLWTVFAIIFLATRYITPAPYFPMVSYDRGHTWSEYKFSAHNPTHTSIIDSTHDQNVVTDISNQHHHAEIKYGVISPKTAYLMERHGLLHNIASNNAMDSLSLPTNISHDVQQHKASQSTLHGHHNHIVYPLIPTPQIKNKKMILFALSAIKIVTTVSFLTFITILPILLSLFYNYTILFCILYYVLLFSLIAAFNYTILPIIIYFSLSPAPISSESQSHQFTNVKQFCKKMCSPIKLLLISTFLITVAIAMIAYCFTHSEFGHGQQLIIEQWCALKNDFQSARNSSQGNDDSYAHNKHKYIPLFLANTHSHITPPDILLHDTNDKELHSQLFPNRPIFDGKNSAFQNNKLWHGMEPNDAGSDNILIVYDNPRYNVADCLPNHIFSSIQLIPHHGAHFKLFIGLYTSILLLLSVVYHLANFLIVKYDGIVNLLHLNKSQLCQSKDGNNLSDNDNAQNTAQAPLWRHRLSQCYDDVKNYCYLQLFPTFFVARKINPLLHGEVSDTTNTSPNPDNYSSQSSPEFNGHEKLEEYKHLFQDPSFVEKNYEMVIFHPHRYFLATDSKTQSNYGDNNRHTKEKQKFTSNSLKTIAHTTHVNSIFSVISFLSTLIFIGVVYLVFRHVHLPSSLTTLGTLLKDNDSQGSLATSTPQYITDVITSTTIAIMLYTIPSASQISPIAQPPPPSHGFNYEPKKLEFSRNETINMNQLEQSHQQVVKQFNHNSNGGFFIFDSLLIILLFSWLVLIFVTLFGYYHFDNQKPIFSNLYSH